MRGGEGWLDARQAALALDRFEQRGFFAANIGAGAEPQFNVEIQAGGENVFTERASQPRFLHRLAHDFERVRKLAANIDKTPAGADRVGRDDHAFEGAVWVLFHENAVFESSGLGFVRVAHDVLGLPLRLCRSLPLDAGWKRRAASPGQARSLHLGEHSLRCHRQSLFQSGVAAPISVFVERRRMTVTAIGREAADIATDKTHRSLPASSTDFGCLFGSGMA